MKEFIVCKEKQMEAGDYDNPGPPYWLRVYDQPAIYELNHAQIRLVLPVPGTFTLQKNKG